MSKEQLQSLQQPEVGVGIFSRGQRLEFNQEVQVAFVPMGVVGGSRAEQIKPQNTVTDAELPQLADPLLDNRCHRMLSCCMCLPSLNRRLTSPVSRYFSSQCSKQLDQLTDQHVSSPADMDDIPHKRRSAHNIDNAHQQFDSFVIG